MRICCLRGSGIGIPDSLPRVQGHGYRIHCRNIASMTSKPVRNQSFAMINCDDISYFKKILGERGVVLEEEKLDDANTDWMRKFKGSSKLMLQPRSTQEVSQILDYCNFRRLAVVPQGGNTGLVGGSVPVFDETDFINLLLAVTGDTNCSLNLNQNGFHYETTRSDRLANQYIMPLDLGAKGSCQIGGNVSTNAGGLRLIRCGSLHGSVLEPSDIMLELVKSSFLNLVSILVNVKQACLEVVLANGTVLDMLGTLRKDNTGYDLKHLFIDYTSCQKLLSEAKRKLGEILSAFEFLDINAMDLVLKHLDGLRDPLPSAKHNFYILIETTGSMESHDKEKLESFLLQSMENGLLNDGVLAQDVNQASSFWRIREGIPEALMKAGAVYKYDLSLPPEKMYNLVEEMRERLATGSISAEHGLGLMKANKIHYSKSAETVQLMAAIKKLLDPNGILNPYKVLPTSILSQSGVEP
ncbi:hypothetical protein DH2020_015539 [Rehmannia glutinosa]|uniref:FAD-binding PCMH-type domain-containing protein n=1 Tax=Rehmannia glutinosa TaxID=99300 RepID=A0ABR0WT39_REHGL